MGKNINSGFNDASRNASDIELLETSIRTGRADLVAEIFSRGVGMDISFGEGGHTPLSLAVQHGQKEVFDLLLEYPQTLAVVNRPIAQRGMHTPLGIAVIAENFHMVERLVAIGAHVNTADDSVLSALGVAAYHGNIKIALFLLEKGADVNKALDIEGKTPLFHAAARGHAGIVRLLLDFGADPCAVSKAGDTLAHSVASWFLKGENLPEIMEILFRAGADINKKDNDGLSPYDIAEWMRNPELMRKIECLLEEKGEAPLVGRKNLDLWGGFA